MNKPWYQSKIIWLQLLGIVIAILGTLTGTYPQYAVALGALANILTIVMRALQGQSVQLGSKNVKL